MIYENSPLFIQNKEQWKTIFVILRVSQICPNLYADKIKYDKFPKMI